MMEPIHTTEKYVYIGKAFDIIIAEIDKRYKFRQAKKEFEWHKYGS